jgi:hypothetical protein
MVQLLPFLLGAETALSASTVLLWARLFRSLDMAVSMLAVSTVERWVPALLMIFVERLLAMTDTVQAGQG